MKNLYIFDWDGTLSDSLARIVAAMQAASADNGMPRPAAKAVHGIVGLGLDEGVAALFPTLAGSAQAHIVEAYRVHYRALEKHGEHLFPGVETFLLELRERGHKLAVATGKSRAGLDRVMAKLGVDSYFHASRCDDEAASKPAPDMVWQLMEELASPAERTVVIGDSVHDLGMAAAAGVAGVGVSYGAHSREQLMLAEPLAVIDDLTQLDDIYP